MTLLNLTRGVARELVGPVDVPRLRASGVLVDDPRRQRPRWFDGRFLSAGDLVREQQYMLSREADLGRAAGSGVATGLRVVEGGPSGLSIQPGHGITPAGELVLLPRRVDLSLADSTPAERLSSRFGLGRIPHPPLRSRTGLFVVALRPVEYTANPVGAYPSSITGQRTVEDGDVIEATAVVLVPWPDDGTADALAARRGRVARELFAGGDTTSASPTGADVLPLAMVAVENNVLVWLDEAMVRRELGADRGDLPGLGFSPRALRLAHLIQHQDHLADVLASAAAGRRGWPAAAHFPALPPAGPLPPGAIEAADFTQGYFPAEIDVDFAPVPEDELPALVEDALALPPIDLSAPAAALDSTAVTIVAPVPRAEWRAVIARLTTVTRPVRPAAPNLLAQRKPFEVLQRLRLPRVAVPIDVTDPSDAEWQRLARLPTLWFVRRRQLALRADGVGAAQAVAGGDERVIELGLRSRLAGLGLEPQLDELLEGASASAAATLTNLLASPRYAASPALTAAAIGAYAEAAREARREAAGRDGDAATGSGGAGDDDAATASGSTEPAGARAAGGRDADADADADDGGGGGGRGDGGANLGGHRAGVAAGRRRAAASLDLASVLRVAADLDTPGTGAGIERMEHAVGGATPDPAALRRLASNAGWRRLDASAGTASGAALEQLARKALGVGAGGDEAGARGAGAATRTGGAGEDDRPGVDGGVMAPGSDDGPGDGGAGTATATRAPPAGLRTTPGQVSTVVSPDIEADLPAGPADTPASAGAPAGGAEGTDEPDGRAAAPVAKPHIRPTSRAGTSPAAAQASEPGSTEGTGAPPAGGDDDARAAGGGDAAAPPPPLSPRRSARRARG